MQEQVACLLELAHMERQIAVEERRSMAQRAVRLMQQTPRPSTEDLPGQPGTSAPRSQLPAQLPALHRASTRLHFARRLSNPPAAFSC